MSGPRTPLSLFMATAKPGDTFIYKGNMGPQGVITYARKYGVATRQESCFLINIKTSEVDKVLLVTMLGTRDKVATRGPGGRPVQRKRKK